MIVRGTTPYHSFIIPALVSEIQELHITYLQNKEVVFTKTLTDEGIEFENLADLLENAHMEDLDEETLSSSQLTVHLTQEDTLKFKFWPAAEKNIAVIQLRILTTDGEAYASFPVKERIFGVLEDGVIGEVEGEEDESEGQGN